MSIGFHALNKEGESVLVPLFRGANTDVNVPLALALVSFVFVGFWGLWTQGLRYLKQFFNGTRMMASMKQIMRGKVKGAFSGLMYGFIDMFVGFIELMSLFIRIVSFTFRLFGNMMAGENPRILYDIPPAVVGPIAILWIGIVRWLDPGNHLLWIKPGVCIDGGYPSCRA